MISSENDAVIQEYKTFLYNKDFPCVAAKAALERQQIKAMVADHMACPKDDYTILQFLYDFVDSYRKSETFFHSAVVIFKEPEIHNDEMFDKLLWQRLQALADLDSKYNGYDKRVDINPSSANFSYSIKEEAFFIIGLNPASSRKARQFKYPALVFNPHAQFEQLRELGRFEKMKNIIRKRDTSYSGSVNPMIDDFGKSSEVYQYSGRQYSSDWKCPLNLSHAKNERDTTA